MKTLLRTARTIRPQVYSVVLLLSLVGMIALYMYFVGMSVVHVVMNKETSQAIGTVKTDISELESQYIEAQHKVRSDLALQEGFIAQSEKVFLAATDSTIVLSFDE